MKKTRKSSAVIFIGGLNKKSLVQEKEKNDVSELIVWNVVKEISEGNTK